MNWLVICNTNSIEWPTILFIVRIMGTSSNKVWYYNGLTYFTIHCTFGGPIMTQQCIFCWQSALQSMQPSCRRQEFLFVESVNSAHFWDPHTPLPLSTYIRTKEALRTYYTRIIPVNMHFTGTISLPFVRVRTHALIPQNFRFYCPRGLSPPPPGYSPDWPLYGPEGQRLLVHSSF